MDLTKVLMVVLKPGWRIQTKEDEVAVLIPILESKGALKIEGREPHDITNWVVGSIHQLPADSKLTVYEDTSAAQEDELVRSIYQLHADSNTLHKDTSAAQDDKLVDLNTSAAQEDKLVDLIHQLHADSDTLHKNTSAVQRDEMVRSIHELPADSKLILHHTSAAQEGEVVRSIHQLPADSKLTLHKDTAAPGDDDVVVLACMLFKITK